MALFAGGRLGRNKRILSPIVGILEVSCGEFDCYDWRCGFSVAQFCLCVCSFTLTPRSSTCFLTCFSKHHLSTPHLSLSLLPLNTCSRFPGRPRGTHDQGHSSGFPPPSSRTSAPAQNTIWRTKNREGPLSRIWAALAAVAVTGKAKIKASQFLSTPAPSPGQPIRIFTMCKCAIVA